MQSDPNLDAVALALAAPFDPVEVKFKPQTVSGNRALALPFVDARVVQERLDKVLGVMGWQDSYEVLPDGAVVCRLKIRLGGEWIIKEDVGGESEQPDGGDRRKAAFSDALKRAAVKFGIGRYLYRQKPQWVDYDPQKRQFLRQPVLQPAQAPEQTQANRKAPMPGKKSRPKDGKELLERLGRHDRRLADEGLCKPGELLHFIASKGATAGVGGDIAAWNTPAGIDFAYDLARDFENARRLASRESLEALDALLRRKGKTLSDLRHHLHLSKGTQEADLTVAQVAGATEWLSRCQDSPG